MFWSAKSEPVDDCEWFILVYENNEGLLQEYGCFARGDAFS